MPESATWASARSCSGICRSQLPWSPSVYLHAIVMQLKNELLFIVRGPREKVSVNITEFLGLSVSKSEVVQMLNAGVGWTEQQTESAKHVAQKSGIFIVSDIGWHLTEHRLTSLTGLSHDGEGQGDVLAQEINPRQFLCPAQWRGH